MNLKATYWPKSISFCSGQRWHVMWWMEASALWMFKGESRRAASGLDNLHYIVAKRWKRSNQHKQKRTKPVVYFPWWFETKKHLFGKSRLFLNIFSLYFQIWGLFLSKPFVAESGAQVVERNQWKGLETLWFTMPEEEFLGFQGGLVGSIFRAMYGWPRLMVLVYVKMFFSSQFLANTLQGLMDIPCVSARFKFCSTSKRGILGTCPTLWDWMPGVGIPQPALL